MAILILSDLHLKTFEDLNSQIFFALLAQWQFRVSAIYILGDLFEYWLGDDDKTVVSQKVQRALKEVSKQGVLVYIMRGNRDFLLGERFMSGAGATLLTDPYLLNFDGKKILLSHGDQLCTDDEAYQRYRQKVHSPKSQARFLACPLWFRRGIAYTLRRTSKILNRQKSREIMDVNPNAVREFMQAWQSSLLIHGHTHRPQFHDVPGIEQGQRIVLDAWHSYGNILVCNSSTNIVMYHLHLSGKGELLCRKPC